MDQSMIDLDLLAKHLQSKMDTRGFTIRPAAEEIGCSPATLSRLLRGSQAANVPDATTLFKAASWVRKSLADLQRGSRIADSTIVDVEVHLRALPGIQAEDKEALIAMVKAAYEAAHQLRKKT